MEKEQDIKKGEEYALRKQTPQEKELNDNDQSIPHYRIKLELDETKQEELIKQIFLEFDALKEERTQLGLEEKWKERDRQYDGELVENKTLAFNLHVHQSKIKTDAIIRAIDEAFLDSDPMVDVSPRPQSGRENGFEVAEKQSDFLDYAIDEEVKPETSLVKIAKSCVTKFVGIGKVKWEYKREKRRREETYEGKLVPIGEINGQTIYENEGVRKFLEVYPDGMAKYPNYIKRLMEGKKCELVVEFWDTVENSPKLDYIKLENFYVKNCTNYLEGLKDTHLIVERQQYSYWDLEKKERKGEFENVEKLWTSCGKEGGEDNHENDYMTKEYDVIEVTTYCKLNESDEEETKVKVWLGEEKKVFLGAEIYPYYGFDTDYLPFYIKLNDDGFYGNAKSVMYDLLDSNIAQDALINLALHGTYIRNILQPIIKEGSPMEDAFMDHTFKTGSPIIVDEETGDISKAIDFVQWGPMDLNGAMLLIEKMKRTDSDVTRVSDLSTGGESALDPTAPAAKTIALLQQSGIGIKDYIRIFLPTFNEFASILLQLYYQMSQSERKFKVIGKSTAVTGENPFTSITREEMSVKTNIQSRAASFVFDKINEKREALAAYQTVMGDPYARQQPKLLYKALKTLLDTFGDRWKAITDTTLASPEEFQQQMNQIALQAVQALMIQAQKQSQATGVPLDPRQVIEQAPGAVQQAQAESYSPELREQREKEQKKNA